MTEHMNIMIYKLELKDICIQHAECIALINTDPRDLKKLNPYWINIEKSQEI